MAVSRQCPQIATQACDSPTPDLKAQSFHVNVIDERDRSAHYHRIAVCSGLCTVPLAGMEHRDEPLRPLATATTDRPVTSRKGRHRLAVRVAPGVSARLT